MNQTPEFLQKIDWALLREQKTTLANITNWNVIDIDYSIIEGIINLIEVIQDYAVDVMGLTNKEVFNLTPEEDE